MTCRVSWHLTPQFHFISSVLAPAWTVLLSCESAFGRLRQDGLMSLWVTQEERTGLVASDIGLLRDFPV